MSSKILARFSNVVGCTIDAGAKIYAGRVDAVHGDILQMLGTMGNAAEDEQNDNGDEGEDIEDAAKKKDKDKKKKKKITLCEGRTIEKNLANIRNPTYDLAFDVDPLIQITTRQSDEQCTASLISYNIALKDDSLLFDSTSVSSTTGSREPPPLPTIDTAHLQSYIAPLLNSERVICPSFHGFRFNNWTCTKEESFYETPPPLPPTQESEQPEPFVPGIEDLDDNDDDFGGAMSSGDEGGVEENGGVQEKQKLTIDDLTLALEPTEYGYFNPRLAQMWAGPGHWKLKPLTEKTSGGEKKERTKKTATVQTFDTPRDDLFKNFIKSRAKTTLAQETIRSNQSSSNLLPVDINYLESSLRKLSMMPLWRGNVKVTHKIEGSQEGRTDWYNYDNPHDRSNYCPNEGPPPSDDDDVGAGEISFGTPADNPTPIGDLELIDAVAKIEKIDIQYAKQAKKIDVKKLKSVMWKNIANSGTADIGTENTAPNSDAIMPEKESVPVKFSNIYKKIPHQVSLTMADNLSVPIAFACLLHLANEHELKLEDNDCLSDIKIAIPSKSK